MKLDKNNTEINHMTVWFNGKHQDIYCGCWDPGCPGEVDVPIDASFYNFNSIEDAIKHGWSIKNKNVLICPECTKTNNPKE